MYLERDFVFLLDMLVSAPKTPFKPCCLCAEIVILYVAKHFCSKIDNECY